MWIPLLLFAIGLAQQPLPQGSIVESIACRDHPDHKYALFLPSDYTPERLWPIVILLDPAARGATPLEAFAPAAEEAGYILVGSYNSRNGPLEPSIEALSVLWTEVSGRYAIDPARVYLAGFSGGARMASHFAKSAQVAGVIACGAGLLSGDAEHFPFVYVAVAGRRDMNYMEVRILAENLRRQHTRATFLEFDGSHDWPPPEIARLALEWLRLEAMRRKLEPVVPSFIESYRDAALERAQALEAGGQVYEALLAYQALVRDVEDLADVAPAAVRARLLVEDARVQEERRKQSRTDDVERREVRALLEQFLSDNPKKGEDWWRRKLDSYQELAKRKLRNAEELSQRLRQFVLSYAGEKAWFASEEGDYAKALYLTRVALLARPQSGELHYRLARLLAVTGDPDGALAALRQAVELGWRDSDRLNRDEVFSELRKRPEFEQLVPPN